MNLYFKIINDHIHHDMSRPPVSDSLNHLTAVFEFDEVWEGCTKTAVFTDKNTAYTVLLEEDSCIIPHEILQGKYFTVSVYGTKDDTRITATELMIPLDKSGYREGETPQEPTLTVYEQILGELERIKGESEIADGAVTTEKIADGAVTVMELSQSVLDYIDKKSRDYFVDNIGDVFQYTDEAIAEAKSIIPKRYLVSALPETDIDTNGTYLVPAAEPNTDNIYTEYAYINDAWEIIGSPFEVDLSGYEKTGNKVYMDASMPYVEQLDGKFIVNASDTSIFEPDKYFSSPVTAVLVENAMNAVYNAAVKVIAENEVDSLGASGVYIVNADTERYIIIHNVFKSDGVAILGTQKTEAQVRMHINNGVEYRSYTSGGGWSEWEAYAFQKDLRFSNTISETDFDNFTYDRNNGYETYLLSGGGIGIIYSYYPEDATGWAWTAYQIKITENGIFQRTAVKLDTYYEYEWSEWKTSNDKTTITSSTAESLELIHNTEARYGEMSTLSLTLPEAVSDDYISSIIFTSGATATALTYPEEIIFTGDDCIDGVFTPIENKRYEVIVWYDGSIFKGIVRGDSI